MALQSMRLPEVTAPLLDTSLQRSFVQNPRFHRSQLLRDGSDAPISSDYVPINVRAQPTGPHTVSQRAVALHATLSRKPATAPTAPLWLSLDDKVLRFFGFFCETAVESPAESHHVRRVVVEFFPVDDTLMIIEPKVPNSGFQGGTLVKRHRVPASAEQLLRRQQRGVVTKDQYVTINDLNVGEDVECYGKVFHLLDCDDGTRRFLNDLGIDVPNPEPYPEDQYFAGHRRIIEMGIRPRGPMTWADRDMKMTFEHQVKGRTVTFYPEEIAKTQKFLRDDGKVLCFSALWDDRDNDHGDLRTFHVKYYLADDTIEVLERHPPNAGRDPGRAFVIRNRLPKTAEARAVNLTFTGRINGTTATAGGAASFYTQADLFVGGIITVFGRPFLLVDCDPYTRRYYADQLGYEQPPPLDLDDPSVQLPKSDPPLPSPVRAGPLTASIARAKLSSSQGGGEIERSGPVMKPPPHNGFGTEEDSLGNWKHLQLKAPKKDLQNWMQNEEKVLRFAVVFADPPTTEDSTRRFMLSFFLGDDTIQVTEQAERNSGFLGGKFLKRQQVKKYAGEGAKCLYKWNDFYVGAEVNILSHLFRVVSMDDYTLRYCYSKANLPAGVGRSEVHELLADMQVPIDSAADKLLLGDVLASRSPSYDSPAYKLMQDFARDFPAASVKDLVSLVDDPVSDIADPTGPVDSIEAARVAVRALTKLQQELERRKLRSADFFRVAAALPRSRADSVGSNPINSQSIGINAFQLQRATNEMLNMSLSEPEMSALIGTFLANERQTITLQEFLTKMNRALMASTLPGLSR